jgi:quinol monooxygenase YgiN
VVGEFGDGDGPDVAAFGGDHLVVDLDEERADEPETHWLSGPWTHAGRVVLLHPLRQLGFIRLNRFDVPPLDRCSRRRSARPGDCPASSPPDIMTGRTLARATERLDPSQQRKSLEAGAVSELQGIARFKIHEGKLDEFKRLSAQAMEIVRTKETGTPQDEIYFNDDQSECMVLERYRDSEAAIEHLRTLVS